MQNMIKASVFVALIAFILIVIVASQIISWIFNDQTIQVRVLITPYVVLDNEKTIIPNATSESYVMPGIFSKGQSVRVSGTGGDTLRIRKNAGLSSEILFYVEEGTSLDIIDGPDLLDGMIWWKVDSLRGTGWTVQSYLEPIQ